MALILLFLVSVWSSAEGSELVGNYKFWNSVSDSIIYDHSGFRNHGRYYLTMFFFTDRGMMTYNSMESFFPSSSIKQYPGYTDFIVSYWYLRKNERSSRMFHVSYTNKQIGVFFEIVAGSTIIRHRITSLATFLSDSSYPTPALINYWRLYTFRVTQNLSNTESTITIYIDLQIITSYVITQASLGSQSDFGVSGSLHYLYGILYEMWWIKDVLDINELDFLLFSSSSCGCSYGCVTSPTIICLPSYDSAYNYQGGSCLPGCPNSCSSDFRCINKSKAECEYGLYDIESGNCLFYCPNDSCIFSISLELTCKAEYKKVSDNPPACIPIQCTSYERKDYKYTCYECEAGYMPDSLGEFCICDTDFTAVSLDPLICIKIDKCLVYQKVGDKYLCSSCLEGYSIDSEGSCNQCESDYIKVLDEPFTCTSRIENCHQYKLLENRWECEKCDVGYIAISDGICIEDVELCDSNNFLSDGSCADCPETCESCNILADKVECNECKQSYTLAEIEDEIICILCYPDNPICKREINGNSESNAQNDGNNSNSQEDIEESTEDQAINSDIKDRAQKIESSTSIATNISLGITALCSALSLDPTNLIRYINDVKVLSYIIYLKIYLPYEVEAEKEASLKNLEDMNLLSNIQISDRNSKDSIDHFIDDSYGFINRIPYQAAILAIILLLNLSLYILRRFSRGKLKALGTKGIEYFTYTAYLQFFMMVYLDVSYYAISKISHVIYI